MTVRSRRLVLAGLAWLVAVSGSAQSPPATPQTKPVDPLAPRTSAASASIGPLQVVTVATANLDGYRRALGDGLGMRMRGPITMAQQVRETQRALWGLGARDRWALYVFDRPTVPGSVTVRLLVFEGEGRASRQTTDPREPGPFTLGFPTTNLTELDARLRVLGLVSLAPMERSRIPRPDGTSYGIEESVFTGPDNVHLVGVSRLEGMPQLGPTDPVTGHGGPAYSAQVVTNSDAVIAFYRDVLGLELRSDREWKSGASSAIGLPPGTPFRLALLYAPGASSGQLLLMDFREQTAASSGVAPRPPNRGIGMYTFPIRDFEATAARIRAAGVTILSGPVRYHDPVMGPQRVLTVLAPNGVIVELVEQPGRGGLQ